MSESYYAEKRGFQAFILWFKNLGRIRRVLSPYMKYVYFLGGVQVFALAVGLYIPLITQVNVDEAILKHNVSLFIGITALAIGVTLLGYLKRIANDFISTCADVEIKLHSQSLFFRKLIGAPFKRMRKYREGELYVRFEEDLDAVTGDMFFYFVGVLTNLLTLIGTLVITFFYSYKIIILVLPFVPILFFQTKLLANDRSELFRQQRRVSEKYYEYVKDRLNRLYLIKVLHIEDEELTAYGKLLKRVMSIALKNKYLEMFGGYLSTHLLQLWTYFCTAYIGYMVVISELSFGQMMAIMLYYSGLTLPVVSLFGVYPIIRIFNLECERAFSILDEASEDEDEREDGVVFDPCLEMAGTIEVDGLKFRFDDAEQDLFGSISFSIPYGEKIAIVGRNGVGKTTLANIMLKLFDYEGDVRFNGVELRKISYKAVRRNIGYLTQDHMLLEGDNLNRLCEDMGGLFDMARDLDEANVKEISGGERQKLSVMRLLSRANYKYYILDEFTNNIDYKSKQALLNYVKDILRDKTVIFITHDENILRYVDKIAILESGGAHLYNGFEEFIESGRYTYNQG